MAQGNAASLHTGLQGQDFGFISEESCTVGSYLCSHSVEIPDISGADVANDLTKASAVGVLLLLGEACWGGSKLNEDFVICEG